MKIGEAIKQKKFDNPVEKAIVNLIYTHNWLRDGFNTILKPYGLLQQHFNVLRILRGKYPEVMCPGEIKEVMLDKGNDITRLLDKLVSMDLAERSLCETNRRKMDILITKKGLDLIKELSEKFDGRSIGIKERLNEEDAEQLSSLLDKMRD
ncbi:MAG: MarR family transcriptional regulator [Pseudopedobacter saltans]|uniref:MarR family transcriptional regulator n=1 Tax=Pseudopedobacter saltans TaxID=151895 RepID=A0A2W5GSG7_9SPHI|nr:MAG: MarR family transcriptional regulator [Pseudopedobacter saltans]